MALPDLWASHIPWDLVDSEARVSHDLLNPRPLVVNNGLSPLPQRAGSTVPQDLATCNRNTNQAKPTKVFQIPPLFRGPLSIGNIFFVHETVGGRHVDGVTFFFFFFEFRR